MSSEGTRTSWRRVRWIWWLTALATCACTAPVLTPSPQGAGAPRITALEIMPARIDSGCPVTLCIDFEDPNGDVVRAVTQWRARFNSRRYHEETEVLPLAVSALAGKTAGRVDVVIVPPHSGSWLYRVQLQDAQGRKSGVVEAHVDVAMLPIWRRPQCKVPSEDRVPSSLAPSPLEQAVVVAQRRTQRC